jgi:hypothetical protein
MGGDSSSNQNNAAYQRAPSADGAGQGMGGNSYHMVPIKTLYPPTTVPQPTQNNMHGQLRTLFLLKKFVGLLIIE